MNFTNPNIPDDNITPLNHTLRSFEKYFTSLLDGLIDEKLFYSYGDVEMTSGFVYLEYVSNTENDLNEITFKG